jgi:pimeloyl-ACP methyl ester carboxylesterase
MGLKDVIIGLSITWFTGSAASGHRYYWEMAYGDWSLPIGERITVPTVYSGWSGGLPHERVPEETIRHAFNLRYYGMGERGGHYPILEVPDVFTSHLRAFLAQLNSD